MLATDKRHSVIKASCLLVFALACNYSCPSAYAQSWPWETGFKWPWEQPPPPTPSPFLQNLNKAARERAKAESNQQANDEARWNAYLQECIKNCVSPMDKQQYLKQTANPQQHGTPDQGWNTLKNALGQTGSTSDHMRGYNGNQAYMGPGRAGTDVTGGSEYHGSFDGTGSLANDGQTTRTMPTNVQWPQ